jgi:hypothetical protein
MPYLNVRIYPGFQYSNLFLSHISTLKDTYDFNLWEAAIKYLNLSHLLNNILQSKRYFIS